MDAFSMWEECGYVRSQVNGEVRMGPPMQWSGPEPSWGSEIFVSGLPVDCTIDELITMANRLSPVYCARMKVEFSGQSRGYAFIQFATRKIAQTAAKMMNGMVMRKDVRIMAKLSIDNRRVLLSGIPADLTPDEILARMCKHVFKIKGVEWKGEKVMLSFDNHAAAATARKAIVHNMKKMWSDHIGLEWGDPE